MAEKVLHEIKVIETDDGFRIEIKGDKERIREFLKNRGAGFGPMNFMRHHRHGHHGPFGFGRFWGWHEDEGDAPKQGSESPRV